MRKMRLLNVAWTAALVCVLMTTGCTYMHHRGYDALRMFDAGITVTSHPCFAFYPGDYFNSTPIGYSGVHGTYYGFAHGQFGKLRFDDESWGALLWGSEELQIGDLNVNDPQEFAPEELKDLKEAGKPIPTTSPCYNVGAVRMLSEDNAPPPMSFIACRRNFHFGWIGVHLAMHPGNILDFLLGWTTLDLMGDDHLRTDKIEPPAAAAPAASPAPAVTPAVPPEK